MERRRTLVAIVAAVMATLAVAACGATGDDDDDDGGAQLRNMSAGEAPFAAATPAAAYDTDGFDAPGGGESSSILGRKLIVSATMEIEAEDVDRSYRAIASLAQEVGGFVAQSDFSQRTASDGERREFATVVIRVPSERHGLALDRIRRMDGVSVMREESRTAEVTEEYVDLQSRLRNLERTEAQYLQLLEDAKTVQDILSVSDRIDSVRLQIEQIEGRLQALDDLVDLSSISVTIAPVAVPKAAVGDGGPRSFGEAFADAWEWSLERIAYLIAGMGYAAVAAIWISGPLALVVAGRRWGRRARPERPSV